ncbi:MAG: amino-acid N-acetyltransferase [Kiritimatiellae bacterium]|nr:amino-acid N-acetyltransferase [Kiritimatiellia bacterium]
MKLADLRGILTYSARFRDKIFVLNIDSEVIASDNFHNLLLDISFLRSVNIKVVLVHGASIFIEDLATQLGITVSDTHGMDITDEQTLKIATMAANHISHRILEGLRDADQQAAVTNAIIAHPAGIIDGEDHLFTGQVERVEIDFLLKLIEEDIIPIIPPLGFDGNGQTYRVNSDGVALEVSEALHAAKLMFVGSSNGVRDSGTLRAQFSIEEAETFLHKHAADLDKEMKSKLQHGLRACRNSVSRVHLIDGREDAALLQEIFSNEGIGTMIYANEYEAIRQARRRDVGSILNLIRESVEFKQVLPRNRQSITTRIRDFHVFEIDRNVVGCFGLIPYVGSDPEVMELECLIVAESHANQGIGRKLMDYAETTARELGAKRLIALSTQAFNYFQQKGGFLVGDPDLLPPQRRTIYDQSKRRSRVLYKDLVPL